MRCEKGDGAGGACVPLSSCYVVVENILAPNSERYEQLAPKHVAYFN